MERLNQLLKVARREARLTNSNRRGAARCLGNLPEHRLIVGDCLQEMQRMKAKYLSKNYSVFFGCGRIVSFHCGQTSGRVSWIELNSAVETLTPVSYVFSKCVAVTVRPVRVVVRRMNPNTIATVRSTKPDQVAEIWLNSRCSIGFHFDVPGG